MLAFRLGVLKERSMRIRGLVVLVLMGGAVATAPAKNKKDTPLPQLFCQAHSVYVQTVNGDPLRPEAVPEDRTAANALIAQLQSWKRYQVVTEPQQADLVWVVRTGRVVTLGAANNGGVAQDPSGMIANPGGPNMSRGGQGGLSGQGGMSPGDSMSAGAGGNRGNAGSTAESPDDILAIYQRPNGEPLTSPLWQKTQHNGLQSPKMPLFEQIRTAVDAGCVSPAAPAPATPPSQ
jgi:hypothetical protein